MSSRITASNLSRYMPAAQFATLQKLCRSSEEKKYFQGIKKLMVACINTCPKMYETDGKQKFCYLHYFTADCDWYVLEIDTENREFFAYTCRQGWEDCAELGYVSIDELLEIGAELDFHWTEFFSLDVVKRRIARRAA